MKLTREYRGRYTTRLNGVHVEFYRLDREESMPGYRWAAEFDDQKTATVYGQTLRDVRREVEAGR